MSGVEPETVRQALRQDAIRANAASIGALCSRCAPLVGWGVQNGFGSLPAPCGVCKVRMESFPHDRGRGWRTPHGALSQRSTWLSALVEATRCGEVSATVPAVRRSRRTADRRAARVARRSMPGDVIGGES